MNPQTQADLSQRDLSNLPIERMSAAERAEMRRRYETFLRAFGRSAPAQRSGSGAARAPRRWLPARARP